MRTSIAALIGFLAYADAHATFQQLWVNGVDQGAFCARLPQSNNPVSNVASNDVACNIANPAPGTCSVMPGDQITVEMHQQPGDRSCGSEAIGGAHYGPILAYMAKVSNATTAVGSSASWFKVAQIGMPSSNPDYFGTQVLNDNCGHWTFTVPTGLASGDYLIRAEAIALHVASSVGGAQLYMTCFQVRVGGSGTVNPPTVKFPGAYSAQDPGILVNIHQQLNTYIIPGPTAYNQASPTVANTPYPTTATWNTKNQPTAVPTGVPAGGIPNAPAGGGSGGTGTTTASGAVQTKYGQCGGQGWIGPTACAAGSSCVASSQYYSQCL